MEIEAYLKLMEFPKEWQEWNMLPPDTYLLELIRSYKPGMESASEHDRNGVFHYWLKQSPSEERLIKLVKLAKLDPDSLMGNSIINDHIKSSKYFSESVGNAI